MLSANAEVPQTAFVAVDHWRGDPSSHFLLLSAPGASAPLWHSACLCSAFSSSALPPLVVCLTVGVRGRRKVCFGCAAWFMHISVYTHAGYRCMCCFPSVCAAHASKATGLIDHTTCAFLSALLGKYSTVSCRWTMQCSTGRCDVQFGFTSY